MDKILAMKQKRAELIKKMRAMVEVATSATRDFNDDEKANYEQLRAEAAALADNIVREEELRSLEGDMPAPGVNTQAQERDLESGIRAARFVKVALLASRTHEPIRDVAERMYPADGRLREAMTEGVAGDGGVAVPQNLYNEIIPLLRQTSVTRSLGVTNLPLPNGNLTLVKQTGAANFKWVGENKPIANSKITMGNIKLSAKKLSGIIPLSNELLRDSSLVADRFVRDEMVAGIAEAEDITALYGTGNENAPSGIVTVCADNKIDVGEALTADVLYEMVGKLMAVKLTNPAFAWRIPGVLWATIYGMQSAAGNYIFRDEMKDGKLCGYPFKIDNNIKVGDDLNGKTQIFFGDWKHFLIGTESALQISVSTDASYTDGSKSVSAFENDLTLMRAIVREDFNVRYKEAFVFADNVFSKASE